LTVIAAVFTKRKQNFTHAHRSLTSAISILKNHQTHLKTL